MSIPFERLGIPVALRRSVSPDAPRSAKVAVAKGLLPTTADVQLSLLYVLAVDADESIAEIARTTLANLPEGQITGGLTQTTFPKILEFITEFRTDSPGIDDRIIHLRQATTRTATTIAQRASVELAEVISRHQERLLLSPEMFVALHGNPNCSDDDLGRAEAFLRMHRMLPEVPSRRPFRSEEEEEVVPTPTEPRAEVETPASALSPQPLDQGAAPPPVAPPVTLQPAQQAVENLEMFELSEAPAVNVQALEAFQFDFHDHMENFSWDLTSDDEEDQDDEEEEEFLSIEKRIAAMTIGERIKLAYLGNQQARKVLVRDSNKIVAAAVVRSGRLTPAEVASFAGNRNLTDDVVREIANNKEYTRKYPVKVALVNNPKTPMSMALSIVSHLHKKDLQQLANNRNVSSVIFTAAKNIFKNKYQS